MTENPVAVAAFSPDGTRVATGSVDGSARVFDAATGAELARLDHDGEVNTVAFSPDGSRVATGSDDGSARVFDAATGAELARLDHDGEVNTVAFSPDGSRVATGSDDRSARVFEVEVGALIQRALCVMTRTLNTAELRRYSLLQDCEHVRLWNERCAHPALSSWSAPVGESPPLTLRVLDGDDESGAFGSATHRYKDPGGRPSDRL